MSSGDSGSFSSRDLTNSAANPPLDDTSPLVYDRIFWLAYLANGLTTMANAMLVRYADFVTLLGGEERQLGLIVGCGMIGSITFRLLQGEAIDRYGAGRIWRWSLVLYTFSLLLHLTVSSAFSPTIFLVRTMLQASLAGFSGSSITFVSLRVPPTRMAEIIGVLGTSGFVGMMLGPLASDWLASGGVSPQAMVQRMFLAAGTLGTISVVATWLATRESTPPRHRRRPPLWKVVARYHPWTISLTSAAMGAGFSIPLTFLRPFSVSIHLEKVGLFFLVYALSAFVARVASRSHFERLGNRPWIISGLILMSISFLCYIPVTQTWQLMIPGVLAGVAHALLFPSIMSAGMAAFPRRYLGVATSLMLAVFDFGMFIGAPVVGIFLLQAKQYTSAAYPLMFSGAAVVTIGITIIFALSSRAASPQKS